MENDLDKLTNSKDDLQNIMYCVTAFWEIYSINVYMFIDLCEYIKSSDAC